MRSFQLFTHLVLLATTPTFLVYPHVPEIQLERVYDQESENKLVSYDDLLHFLEEIESAEFENRCTPEEIERITHFVAFLAKQGEIPDHSQEALDDDIEGLLQQKENIYEGFSLWSPKDFHYELLPASLTSTGEILLCKSWVKKQLKHVKKFVKKHKKEIIIGTAVVVGVGAIALIAAAASSAAAVAAGAATAATSLGAYTDPSTADEASSNPEVKSVLDQNIEAFKNHIDADTNATPNEMAIADKARELGSHFTHKAFDELADIGAMVPAAWAAVQAFADQHLPDNTVSSQGAPTALQNYGKIIEAGHQRIDELFSTDQAQLYTPESKATDIHNQFVSGEIPLPGAGIAGSRRWQIKNPVFQPGNHAITNINGRIYRGHALDQMQNRGIPPSVVEHTIEKGEIISIDKARGTVEYYDPTNEIKVVLNEQQEVVTAIIVDQAK